MILAMCFEGAASAPAGAAKAKTRAANRGSIGYSRLGWAVAGWHALGGSVQLTDGRYEGGGLEAELAEHHPVGGGSAAGMERDPLLDRGIGLAGAIFEVED